MNRQDFETLIQFYAGNLVSDLVDPERVYVEAKWEQTDEYILRHMSHYPPFLAVRFSIGQVKLNVHYKYHSQWVDGRTQVFFRSYSIHDDGYQMYLPVSHLQDRINQHLAIQRIVDQLEALPNIDKMFPRGYTPNGDIIKQQGAAK